MNTLHKPGWQKTLIWVIPVAFLVYFFYQPLVAIFRLVFSPAFSAGWQTFDPKQVSQPFFFTLYQASLSTLLTLVVGLPAAYIFARFDFWGRKSLRMLSILPFILPTVVVATAFNSLIGPRGWLNLGLMALFDLSNPPLNMLNSLPAILLAHVFYNSSIIIRMVGSTLSRLNPRLTDAARMLGASPLRAAGEVTLPLLMPTLTGATLLVFLFNFTSFGVIMMLGGPRFATLEVEIYTQAMQRLNLPVAGLLTIIQLVLTLAITWLYNRVRQPKYGKSAMSGEAQYRLKPRNRREKTFVILVALLIICLMALPLLSLVSRSVFTLDAARGERGAVQTGFTLRYYQELFVNRTDSLFYVPPLLAIRNSLVYSALAMLISTAIGVISAYALARTSPFNRFMEPFIMLPLGASSVTLGLGFLIVFNHPPWNSPSFPLLIPIAHSLVALPLVLRTLLPALRSIPQSLRDAASMLGADQKRVFLEVDLPLLLRAVLVSMVFAFTISLGEFGAATFLASPQQPTIPVAIYRFISQPGAINYGQALAMSTVLMAICVISTLFIEKIRLPGEELF
ncbi:MAG: iron ABC transporter permease [Anaerolineaceae bacterium]